MSSLTLTLIQTDLSWEDKEANLAMLEKKIKAIVQPAQVIILPEMFATGFSMRPHLFAESMDGTVVNWMKSMAAEKTVILTGSIMIKEEDVYYNRLIWMLPNGKYGYYDKRHLFAYGDEQKYYTPGNKKLIASVNGWKINLLVCYDLRFPVWSRQAPVRDADDSKNPEYDVLLYIANWPERRIHAWKILLQARAIENQCYVIGLNRVGHDGNNIYHSGNSMVIGPLGEVLYHKEQEEDVFTITLQKDILNEIRNKFPFWKDADQFIINNE